MCFHNKLILEKLLGESVRQGVETARERSKMKTNTNRSIIVDNSNKSKTMEVKDKYI